MKKKKPNRRVMYAVAAGAVLALVFLMRSRSQGAPAGVAGAVDPSALDPSTGLPFGASFGGGTPATTFADNGAAAGQSLDYVGQALTSLDSSIGQLAANQQQLGDYFASAPWQSSSTSTTTETTTTPLADAIAGASGILALATQLAPAVAKPAPTPAAKAAPAPKPAATTAGYHAGHSTGHEYYLPGTGWVSKARYTAATKKK
jgi:hypothetical protein